MLVTFCYRVVNRQNFEKKLKNEKKYKKKKPQTNKKKACINPGIGRKPERAV